MDCTRCKAFHRDAALCWLQCFPQLCQVGWMSAGWWSILDRHRKLLSVKNPAALQFLTQSNWCAWHLLLCPVQRHLNLMSCPFTLWMAHIHNPCLNCLKASKWFFNLSPPLHLHWLKWIEQVTSIRDHHFHLDSPGQSMSWKEQVFLMFCTLSVYVCVLYECAHTHTACMCTHIFCTLTACTHPRKRYMRQVIRVRDGKSQH